LKDDHISNALCRNILIDLLETGGKPEALTGEKRLGYTIRAIAL
jgi:hypothetical protein